MLSFNFCGQREENHPRFNQAQVLRYAWRCNNETLMHVGPKQRLLVVATHPRIKYLAVIYLKHTICVTEIVSYMYAL
jgi:hypothetical protein